MSIRHTDVNTEGKILKSEFVHNDSTIEISIKCLDVYNGAPIIDNRNNIASLFESYRRNMITPDDFQRQYLDIKESLIERFIRDINVFSDKFVFYSFKSHDTIINSILNEIKLQCISLFRVKNSSYKDISDCLVKRPYTPSSEGATFDSIMDNYDFNSEILLDDKKNNNIIERLFIIDDTISKGKAIYVLLNNLYNLGVINSSTLIRANFIYCMETQFANENIIEIIRNIRY